MGTKLKNFKFSEKMRFQSFSLLPSFLALILVGGIVDCNHNYLWGGDQTAAPFVEGDQQILDCCKMVENLNLI